MQEFGKGERIILIVSFLAAFLSFHLDLRAIQEGHLVLDWAIFREVMDNIAHARSPLSTHETFGAPADHFGYHMHLLLYPLAFLLRLPFVAGREHAALLLILNLSLAFVPILLRRLSIESGAGGRVANIVAALSIFYFPLWSLSRPGFHPEGFFAPAFLWFLLSWNRGKYFLSLLPLTIALAVREESALFIALFMRAATPGGSEQPDDSRRGAAARLILFCLAFFVLEALLMSRLRSNADGGYFDLIFKSRYRTAFSEPLSILFDDPGTPFLDILVRLRHAAVLVLPFLPLARRGRLLPWLVPLAFLGINLASGYPNQWNDAFYYNSLVVTGFLALAAREAADLDRAGTAWTRRFAAVLMSLLVTIPVSGSLGFLWRGEIVVPSVARKIWRALPPEDMASLRECSADLPDRASIVSFGLGDYISGPTVRLETAVRAGLLTDRALIKKTGDNLDARFRLDPQKLTEWVSGHYRPVRVCGDLVLLELIKTSAPIAGGT